MRGPHRLAWLLAATLALAACSGDEGGNDPDGGSSNGETTGSDEDGGDNDNTGEPTGGSNDPNTGNNDPTTGTTGTNGETTGTTGTNGETTGTTGTNGETTGTTGTNGETNGGGNAGFTCAGAGTAIVAAAGGTVASDDSGAFVLAFAPNALTADTTIKVCAVPSDKVPSAVNTDGAGPVTSVYRIEPATLPLASNVTATSSLALSNSVLTAITKNGDVAPLLLRAAAEMGAPTTLTGTEMRGAFPGAASLHGQHASGGYVYGRHLDAAGLRHLVRVVPAASSNVLTGVPIQIGVRAAADGTPTTALDVGLRTVGCDLEPIALSGTEETHTRDDAFGCEAEPIDWTAAVVVTGGGSLGAGAVVDLTVGGSDVDATHTPPTFFCTHPGTARAQVQLRFLPAGGTTPLTTLVGTQDFTCTWSGDRIVAANYATMTRVAHGSIVPTVAPFGAPLPLHDVAFVTEAYRAATDALGGDGFYYKDVNAALSEAPVSELKLLAPNNDATLEDDDFYEAATYGEGAIDNKEPTDPNTADIDVQYFTGAGGLLRVERETATGAVELQAAGADTVNVAFGSPAGAATLISFADGSADTVYIRGVIRQGGATGAIEADGFARWLRASDLPLVAGRRTFSVLTEEQAMTLATAAVAPTHFWISFLKTGWDEARTLWPSGAQRVAPAAGGVVYQVSSSRLAAAPVAGPCPTTVQTGTNAACKSGPNEVLAVAVGGKIELFSPIDGSHLRTLVQPEVGDPDGFVHVVHNAVDHCLYATQQTTGSGNGIWQYGSDGGLMSPTAYFSATDFTPAGMFNAGQGPLLFVANEEGGVDVVNTAAPPGIVASYDAAALARSVTGRPSGQSVDLYLSDVATAANDGSIRLIPAGSADGATGTTFLDDLTRPAQVALDFAFTPNLLVALSGENAVAAYAFSGATVVRYVDDLYQGGEEPVGIWPLLNEHWLVAGDNIGVDVVMPGSHVRTKANTAISANAAQISRLCLP